MSPVAPEDIAELVRVVAAEVRAAAEDAATCAAGRLAVQAVRVKLGSAAEDEGPWTLVVELAEGQRGGPGAVPDSTSLPAVFAELPVASLKEMDERWLRQLESAQVRSLADLATLPDERVAAIAGDSNPRRLIEFRTKARLLAVRPLAIEGTRADEASLAQLASLSPSQLRERAGEQLVAGASRRLFAQLALASVALSPAALRSITLGRLVGPPRASTRGTWPRDEPA